MGMIPPPHPNDDAGWGEYERSHHRLIREKKVANAIAIAMALFSCGALIWRAVHLVLKN